MYVHVYIYYIYCILYIIESSERLALSLYIYICTFSDIQPKICYVITP